MDEVTGFIDDLHEVQYERELSGASGSLAETLCFANARPGPGCEVESIEVPSVIAVGLRKFARESPVHVEAEPNVPRRLRETPIHSPLG